MDNSIFDLKLALSILQEECIIDEITAHEIQKKSVSDIKDLFAELEQQEIRMDFKNRLDIECIYGIIYREQSYSGGYRRITAKTAVKIRSMIWKWNPPVAGQMRIGEVVKDIFLRACNRVEGERYYYNGHGKEKYSKGRYAYKLIISGEVIVFLDLNRFISYHIVVV